MDDAEVANLAAISMVQVTEDDDIALESWDESHARTKAKWARLFVAVSQAFPGLWRSRKRGRSLNRCVLTNHVKLSCNSQVCMAGIGFRGAGGERSPQSRSEEVASDSNDETGNSVWRRTT